MGSSLIAAYVGTFDPITNGHLDVIERASRIFQTLIIGIGHNQSKKVLFNLEERTQMVKDCCHKLDNVRVATFDGLAVDFATLHHVRVMVRGLRTEADFAYEMQMSTMNRLLSKDLETVFIPTRQDLSHISSTLVKEVASLHGNVSTLIPSSVYTKLKARL